MLTINPKEIKTHPFFENLFPIQTELQKKIETDMREGTYDLSQPVILATWNGQNEPVCIDGHTRLTAAINAGIEELPVWTHEFDTEEEAIKKAIMLQQNRRNMSDADIVACVAALDSRRMRGGDRRSEEAKSKASSDAIENPPAKSAAETADLLGISTTKVERTRTVLDHADPETLDDVKKGKKSIHKANKEIREKKKKASDDKPKAKKSEVASMPTSQPQSVSEDTPAEEQPADTGVRKISIPDVLYGGLKELGGAIEDHVALAVEQYLERIAEENEEGTIEDPIARIVASHFEKIAQQDDEEDLDEDEYDDEDSEEDDEQEFDDGDYDD